MCKGRLATECVFLQVQGPTILQTPLEQPCTVNYLEIKTLEVSRKQHICPSIHGLVVQRLI